jgi:hypothetical protein
MEQKTLTPEAMAAQIDSLKMELAEARKYHDRDMEIMFSHVNEAVAAAVAKERSERDAAIADLREAFVQLYDQVQRNEHTVNNGIADLYLAMTPVFAKTMPRLLEFECDVTDIIGKPDRSQPERLKPAPQMTHQTRSHQS